MNTMLNQEKFPTSRQTRIALLVLLPLAIIGGSRAVAWADLQFKTWTSGSKLTAADLNAEFGKVKTAVDDLQAKQGGYVGSILIKGTCGYVAQLGPSPFAFSTLSAGGTCTATTVKGTVPGANLEIYGGAADVPAGAPLSFSLSGPAGHYEVIMTGEMYGINNADRLVVATRWLDGSSGAVGGFSLNGAIEGGSTGSPRYAIWGISSAGFSFTTAFSTTLSFQASNVADTTSTQAYAQPRSNPAGPLEIRVYKR